MCKIIRAKGLHFIAFHFRSSSACECIVHLLAQQPRLLSMNIEPLLSWKNLGMQKFNFKYCLSCYKQLVLGNFTYIVRTDVNACGYTLMKLTIFIDWAIPPFIHTCMCIGVCTSQAWYLYITDTSARLWMRDLFSPYIYVRTYLSCFRNVKWSMPNNFCTSGAHRLRVNNSTYGAPIGC